MAEGERLNTLLLVLDPHTVANPVLEPHLVGMALDREALGVGVGPLLVDAVHEVDLDGLELCVDISDAEPL